MSRDKTFGALRGQRLKIGDREVALTPTEHRLLETLRSEPGRVFKRSELVSLVIAAVVLERTIDVHVKALRKKLGSSVGTIQTVRGAGYRFVPLC